MCNASNHRSGCTCGWGGEGHLGKSPGGWQGGSVTPNAPIRFESSYEGGYRFHSNYISSGISNVEWRYRDDDYTHATVCPHCGEQVYFVRHNGGSVWFDDLGNPWPKHGCFDRDNSNYRGYGTNQIRPTVVFDSREYGHNTTHEIHELIRHYAPQINAPQIGIVIKGEYQPDSRQHRIVIKTMHSTILAGYTPADRSLFQFIGRAVMLSAYDAILICLAQNIIVKFPHKPSEIWHPFIIGGLYQHQTFGIGKLLEVKEQVNVGRNRIDDYYLTVDFDAVGIKKLVASYGKLQPIESVE